MNITDIIRDRFNANVDRAPGFGPRGDCWRWTASHGVDGYPSGLTIDAKRRRAGQISLYLNGKPMPEPGLWALHSCDNPGCVNPDHLRWGTELDNIKDAIARRKHGVTFSEDDVRFIRSSPLRHCDLARQFNTNSAAILNIRKRVSHKHVE